jgi:isoleucyl-tRNA synthetase
MLEGYKQYDFQVIFHGLNGLSTIDLSAFYVDVSKDRLYTFAADAPERRSAQTAMYVILDGLCRLMATVLPITADELWAHLPGRREESVHLTVFPEVSKLADDALVAEWNQLIAVRDQVNQAIEILRKEKVLGNSLQARVRVTAGGGTFDLLASRRDQLPMLFIVSDIELRRADVEGPLSVEVERVQGTKCERCWRYVPEISQDPERAGLCPRCVGVLTAATS